MKILTRDKEFYRSFFRMLVLIAFQNIIVYAVNLADTIMLGAYSEAALSGASLVNQIQALLQFIANGIGEGIAVLAAQYWGSGQTKPIKKVTNVGLCLGIVVGIVFTIVTFSFPHWTLHLLTDDETVIEQGIRYLKVVSWSYILFGFSYVMLAALRGVEDVKIGLVISAVTLVLNITLNYILIFGKLGMPRLGAAGAAAATLASRALECLIVVVYIARKEQKLRFRFRDFISFDSVLTCDYFKAALPLILSGATWGIAQGVQTSILGHMGGTAIAANSMAAAVFSVVSVAAYGGAAAASVLTGKTVGSGNLQKLHEYTKTLQFLFLGIGIISGGTLFALKDTIISFFSVSTEARDLARQFMTVLSVTLVGTSYQVACLTGIVRGGGNTKFVLYNDLIFMWLLVLPSAALCAFVFKTPPVIVFICLKSDQVLKGFVALFEVNSYHWVKKLTRETLPDQN